MFIANTFFYGDATAIVINLLLLEQSETKTMFFGGRRAAPSGTRAQMTHNRANVCVRARSTFERQTQSGGMSQYLFILDRRQCGLLFSLGPPTTWATILKSKSVRSCLCKKKPEHTQKRREFFSRATEI